MCNPWLNQHPILVPIPALTRSVLKDIRSEREKLGPLDVARVNVMMLGAFFLEYFCLRRAASGSPATGRERAAGREVQEQNGAISSLKGKERAVDGDAATLGEGVSRAVTEGDADETMQEKEQKPEWDFALVAEWLEPWAFKLVLVRSETALQDKVCSSIQPGPSFCQVRICTLFETNATILAILLSNGPTL